MQSRQKFLAQAGALRRTAPRKAMGFLPRFATGFVAAALVAAVLGTGAVAASGSALPGDPLYGLKRTVEQVRLQSASSPTQRQELQHEFERRRISEANDLLDAGRKGEVEFTGTIEVIQPNAWIVSSLVVQLDANTHIAGTPQIDRVAEVRGVTGPNGLRASSISIESSGEPEMTATPEVAETPQATETPEPTETVTPSPTTRPQLPATISPKPAATATQQPTNTPRPPVAPRPTETPEPTSTPTPTPEPVEVEFSGNVNAMDSGVWTIDSTTITVTNDTTIQGGIHPGMRVRVKALRMADDSLIATNIELAGGGKDGNSNTNDQQNSNNNQNSNDGNTNGNDNNSNTNGQNSNDDHGDSNHNENSHDSHGGNGNGN